MSKVDNPARCGRQVVGIFAKEPVAGKVKTRLCPPLSPSQAAALSGIAIEETVVAMRGAPLELVLFYTGSRDYFAEAFPGLTLIAQGEGDLGARMGRALEGLLADGFGTAALLGADSPDLPPARVAAAFAALTEAEAVTVPASDGGYVLIAERRHRPELFADIPWSSAEVLTRTRQRAAAAGIVYRELPGWEDVDDWPSLCRLCRRSPASRTARYAASLPVFPPLSAPV